MPEEHVTGIERDLAALLAIDPSPEFAAGVLARAANAGPPRRWTIRMLAAAAILTMATGGALLMRTATRTPAGLPPIATGATAVAEVVPQPGPSKTSTRVAAKPAARARARLQSGESEIVIDPAFRHALQRLLRDAEPRRATVDLAAAVAATDPAPADLAVAPMTIDDLAVPVINIGDPQTSARR